ncbi:MAG: hypothetical protein ABR543_05770 [Gemmatimonadaceae bacterium]
MKSRIAAVLVKTLVAALPALGVLLWTRSASLEGRPRRGVGLVERPANAFLGQVVNAGWVVMAESGDLYFASAVRP